MKRGQCSNAPAKCSNAANAVLLPYAGVNSICPECGAPLALIATDAEFTPTPQAAPQNNSRTFEPDYEDDEPQGNQALEFAKMAGLFVIVAGAAFFGLKYFANRGPDTAATNMVIGNEMGNQISPTSMAVVDINPNIIGKTAAISEVRASPSISAQSLGQLAAGVALDINGKVSVDGIEWYRISMPNQSGISGYVRAQEITSLDGITMGTMTNQVAPLTPNAPPAPPVITAISDIPEATFYISGDKANIRSEAGVSGARIGESTRGTSVSANASRKVDGRTWYRVTTANGITGWVSSSLLSSSPVAAAPAAPKDAEDTSAVAKPSGVTSGANVLFNADGVKVRQAPDASSGIETEETQRGMVVQVDDVQTNGSSTWYHVHSNRFNIDGWVEAKNVKPADN